MAAQTVQTVPAGELAQYDHVDTAGDLNGLASGITTGSVVRVVRVNHVYLDHDIEGDRGFVSVLTDRGERYAWPADQLVDVHRRA